jgi:hypothetical protein
VLIQLGATGPLAVTVIELQKLPSTLAVTRQVQIDVMVLTQRWAMANGHIGDTQPLALRVQKLFHIRVDGRGALVENSVFWAMEEQASHGQPLLLAQRQRVLKVDELGRLLCLKEVTEVDLGTRSEQ